MFKSITTALLLALAAPAAAITTVRFDDPAITGPLNTQYASYGITFAQSGAFSTARAYNDVRDPFDQRGYAGTAERGNPTVLFTTPVDNLSFDFVTIGHPLIAIAFNDANPFLDFFSEAMPTGVVTSGTRSFTASGIQGFRIVDIDQLVGISALRFDVRGAAAGVPEPTQWMLLIGGFGLAGAAARRRRKENLIAA